MTLFFAADERPGEVRLLALFSRALGSHHAQRIMIGFGQNAVSGELAMGVGAPKSATKCQRLETLDSLDVIDIAAGQNTTFFLVRPPAAEGVVGTEGSITNEDKFGDLPRFPAALCACHLELTDWS